MDSYNPKVSFIPKGSLIREESFLERRRPRSIIGFIAFFAFIIIVGSYAGLYYYETTLSAEVATKTEEIKQAQEVFTNAPQVGKAKLFRARADLAKELLDSHTEISPVFSFISKNTVASIVYDKFSFLNGSNGQTLSLSGEAPSYAALAYQADTLKSNTNELLGFTIHDVALTKFSTVTFTLDLSFKPDFLSYAKNSNGMQISSAPAPIETSANQISEVSQVTTGIIVASSSTVSTSTSNKTVAQSSTSTNSWPSREFWISLWSKFKFW